MVARAFRRIVVVSVQTISLVEKGIEQAHDNVIHQHVLTHLINLPAVHFEGVCEIITGDAKGVRFEAPFDRLVLHVNFHAVAPFESDHPLT